MENIDKKCDICSFEGNFDILPENLICNNCSTDEEWINQIWIRYSLFQNSEYLKSKQINQAQYDELCCFAKQFGGDWESDSESDSE